MKRQAGPDIEFKTNHQRELSGLSDFRYLPANLIRAAQPEDAPAIWSIIQPVIRAGETYILDQYMTKERALEYRMGLEKETFVAQEGCFILGTYYMRSNQAGGGSHVCNCGFIVNANATGRGIAGRMGEHALVYARARGYRGMQFNFVVSTNERAVVSGKSLDLRLAVGCLSPSTIRPMATSMPS